MVCALRGRQAAGVRAGDSGPTLHLLDVDAAKRLPLEIPNVPAAVDWLPDGSGFFYQRVDPTGREGLFHRMGGQPGADVQLYRQATPPNAENLPPTWGPFGSVSRDGHWFVLGFGRDAVSNDLWVANFDEFRKTGRLAGAVVSVGTPGQASGTVVDGMLFLRTTKGAPRGRVIAVRAGDPAESRWRDVVAERPDAVIEDVSFGRGRIAVTYRKNAADVVEIFDTAGKPVATLAQPGLGVSNLTAQEDRTEAFLTFTSFNYPPTVFRVDLADPAAAPVLWMAPEAAVDPTSVQVEQVWYPSRDGTRISMFLVHKSGLGRTGDTPALLVGYGGFGVSMTPTFSATFFQWFEAGGLLAVPNVRGGGEYGDAWHAAGMLDRKQHAFDDFIAAAEWLAANKYTNPQRLALYGGGHGALLTAAALTQRPDLFRAAVARLPVLDMLRYQQFLAGRSWAPEYGSADHPEQFKWLLAYSPYQRVQGGTKYPGVLLTAVEDDPAIHPMHARKMVAALRAATASDPADHPILLRVDATGQLDPDAEFRDLVDQRLFIMWQLGVR
jgi:prolyl oligopeptidase